MPFDPLEALREAGQPVDLLSRRQRETLAALTEHEVEVLLSIQRRLSEAEPVTPTATRDGRRVPPPRNGCAP
jgi:hypothetical protein